MRYSRIDWFLLSVMIALFIGCDQRVSAERASSDPALWLKRARQVVRLRLPAPEKDRRRRHYAGRAFSLYEKRYRRLGMGVPVVRRARILKLMAFSLFLQRPHYHAGKELSVFIVRGMAYIRKAATILDNAGLKTALADLYLETADELNLPYFISFISTGMMQVERNRDGCLVKAAALYRKLRLHKKELAALRRIRRRSARQIQRSVTLATWIEGGKSLPMAKDMVLLTAHHYRESPHHAVWLYEEAARIFSRYPDKQVREGECYLNIGMLQKNQKKGKPALASFRKAFDVFKKAGRKGRLSYCSLFIAALYFEQGRISDAADWFRTAYRYRDCPRRKSEAALGSALVMMKQGRPGRAAAILKESGCYSWSIIGSEFNRFFINVDNTGVKKLLTDLFRRTGDAKAAAAVRTWQ